VAVWIVVRFPERAPTEFRRAMIHFGVSMVGMYVISPIVQHDLASMPQPFQLYLSVFGVLLPALIYRMVATIWLLRLATGSLRSAMR
jgi:mannose/fructose/N-acetylgalactosamine-specific phosphotransferase system component IIC